MSNELTSLFTRIGIFAVLIAIFFWMYQDPQRDESGSIIQSGNIDPLELFVGDCYMESFALEEGEFKDSSSVDAVPCSALHNNEVIGVFQGLSWSKEDILSKDAFEEMSEKCIAEMIIYTNFQNENSDEVEIFDTKYGMNILFTRLGTSEEPDPDRKFSCILSNVSELTKTSVRNYFR